MADELVPRPETDAVENKANTAVRRILKLGKENGFSIYQPAEKEKWLQFSRTRGFGRGIDSKKMAPTIRRALSGDPKAIEAIRSSISDYYFGGDSLPPIVVCYLAEKEIEVKSDPKFARRSNRNHRDYYIAWAVQVATGCGLRRSRADVTKISKPEKTSACSLVARVLAEMGVISLTEDRVLRIADEWRKKPPFLVGKMDPSEYR